MVWWLGHDKQPAAPTVYSFFLPSTPALFPPLPRRALIRRLPDRAANNDADTHSALSDPTAGASYDRHISQPKSACCSPCLTESSTARPTHPFPEAPSTPWWIPRSQPLPLLIDDRDVSTLGDPVSTGMTLRRGQWYLKLRQGWPCHLIAAQ